MCPTSPWPNSLIFASHTRFYVTITPITVGEGTIAIVLKKPTSKHMLRVGDVVILTRRITLNGHDAWATRSPDPEAKKKPQRFSSLLDQHFGKFWARCPLATVQVRMLVSKYGLEVGDIARVIGQSGCKNFWKLKMPGAPPPYNVLQKTRGLEWVEVVSAANSNLTKQKPVSSSSNSMPAVSSSLTNDKSAEPKSVTSSAARAPMRVKRSEKTKSSSPRKKKQKEQKEQTAML